MRLVGQYYANDWLFIKNATFLVDGQTASFAPDMERDNSGGKIWEWFDMSVSNPEVLVPYAMLIDGKEAKVRYTGNQYYNDRNISQKELKAIKDTHDYYIALGGK